MASEIIQNFLNFTKKLSMPESYLPISFQDLSSLNVIKKLLTELPILNQIYTDYRSNHKSTQYIKLFFL